VGALAAASRVAFPFLAFLAQLLYDAYYAALAYLPPSWLPVAGGLLLVFFGGSFYTLIAAAEAWEACGGASAASAARTLKVQLTSCLAAAAADEAKEGGAGGKAAPPRDQLRRRALLMARHAQPDSLSAAAGALWLTAMGMLATLRLRLARTLVLGASISAQVLPLAEKHAKPLLDAQLPSELLKWSPTLLEWAVKAAIIGTSLFLSKLVGAAHSALRGGRLVAAHGLVLLKQAGHLRIAVDEKLINAAALFLAAVGVLAQTSAGFSVPFPLSVVVLPLSIAEWLLTIIVGASAL
jgi:hypothetical protein